MFEGYVFSLPLNIVDACTLQRMYTSTHVHFNACTLQRMYTSTHVHFNACTLQRMYTSTHVHFNACTLQHMALRRLCTLQNEREIHCFYSQVVMSQYKWAFNYYFRRRL